MTQAKLPGKTRTWFGYQWKKLTQPLMVSVGGVRVAVDETLPRGVRRAIYRGDYEREERLAVERYVKLEDRVLEAGAGIGVVSLTCAQLASEGAVLSYEANPVLSEKLLANIALNEARVEVRNRALSVCSGQVSFHPNANFLSSSLFERSGSAGAVSVESDCFNDVISEFRPTVIVMDIEGAEIDVLVSADLKGIRMVIVELHPHIVGQSAIDGLLAAMHERGFENVWSPEGGNTVVLQSNGADAV